MYTSIKEIPKIYEEVKGSFAAGKTSSIDFRLEQIKRIVDLIEENQQELIEAISKDGKCEKEALLADLLTTKKEALTFLSQLKSWVYPSSYSLSFIFKAALDGAYAVRDPLGTVLIIGTWNYPFNTAICPLIGAIAGGNTVILKLSEVAENTAQIIAKLLPKYIDQSCYRVVNGSVPEATALLKLRWDHIFYTGNTTVGKIIAKAAAEYLTPCTLELGGKSPCIIDSSVDLATTAKRIAYGKFINCGQTCIAPDYLLIPSSIKEAFLEKFKAALVEFYGPFDKQQEWTDYGRIVSEIHFKRLKSYLDNTNGEIVLRGEIDKSSLFIGPTVVVGGKENDALLNEEIFGPILVVVEYETIDDAIKYVKSREKPLVCYMFSNDSKAIDNVTKNVPAGGMVINDTVMHFVINSLPFGGVGNSGYGRYHGKYSFETFTHEKPVLWRTNMTDLANVIRYAPYTEGKIKAMQKLMVEWSS